MGARSCLGVPPNGVSLIGVHFMVCLSWRASQGARSMGVCSMNVRLMGVRLIGVHLMSVPLTACLP
jgi:hypothetical protein